MFKGSETSRIGCRTCRIRRHASPRRSTMTRLPPFAASPQPETRARKQGESDRDDLEPRRSGSRGEPLSRYQDDEKHDDRVHHLARSKQNRNDNDPRLFPSAHKALSVHGSQAHTRQQEGQTHDSGIVRIRRRQMQRHGKKPCNHHAFLPTGVMRTAKYANAANISKLKNLPR